MDDPEAVALATLADAGCDHAEAGPRPKLCCLGANARGHVDRVPGRERRPADVWHASSGFLRTPCPRPVPAAPAVPQVEPEDRKSTRLNSSHLVISYAVFCLKKKRNTTLYKCSKNKIQYKDPHAYI